MQKHGERRRECRADGVCSALKQKQRKARVIEELNKKKIEGEFSSAYCVPNLLAPL